MTRPRWILDLHEDFPASALVAARVPDPLILDWTEVMKGRFPQLPPGPLVGYGTMRMMTRLRREPGLGAAVFDDYAQLRCSSYYRALYPLLGRACVLVPFAALATLPLARMFGPRVFIRSDTNFKLFAAQELAVAQIPEWMSLEQAHRDELVVVSEVVRFEAEYRCICREGRFVCGSSYPDEPYRPVPLEVRARAEEAARLLLPAGLTMVTIDLGLCGGALKLVEAGGVNSWGLYGSDPDAFITAMEAEALARFSG